MRREGGVQPGDLLPVGSPPPTPHPAPGPDPQTSPPSTPARAGKSWVKGRNEPPHGLFQKRPIG